MDTKITPIQTIIMQAWVALNPKIPPGVALAICHHETGGTFDPCSRSPKTASDEKYGGAYGLCQMLLPTARDVGYTGTAEGLYNPAVNAHFFAKLARKNSQTVGVSPYNIIAAHNCGARRVAARTIPPDTKNIYIPAVMKFYEELYKDSALVPAAYVPPTPTGEPAIEPLKSPF